MSKMSTPDQKARPAAEPSSEITAAQQGDRRAARVSNPEKYVAREAMS